MFSYIEVQLLVVIPQDARSEIHRNTTVRKYVRTRKSNRKFLYASVSTSHEGDGLYYFPSHYENSESQAPYQDAIASMKMYTKMLILSLSFSGRAFRLDAGSRDHVKHSSLLENLPISAQIISVADPSLAF